MKVVIFCGGMGTRIRDHFELLPKPLIPVGSRPILWHIMKYYSSFGIQDFVFCLGYKADAIKQYFLTYNEAIANDFVLRRGKQVELLRNDIDEWSMTFVDTGLNELIGQHNDWFPIERQLPIDIRTRDYRLINGRSYRRPVLDAGWAAGEFPPRRSQLRS